MSSFLRLKSCILLGGITERFCYMRAQMCIIVEGQQTKGWTLLVIRYLSLKSKFILHYLGCKNEAGSFKYFPQSVSTTLNFVRRGRWRDTAGERKRSSPGLVCSFWQAPASGGSFFRVQLLLQTASPIPDSSCWLLQYPASRSTSVWRFSLAPFLGSYLIRVPPVRHLPVNSFPGSTGSGFLASSDSMALQ